MKKLFLLIFLLNSCVIDRINRIAVIKNLSNQNIVVVFEPTDSLDDETLFYGSKYPVYIDSSTEIKALSYQYDKIYFFVLNYDSVYNSIKDKNIKGIVKRAFLKKITADTDSLKNNGMIIYK